MIDWIQLVASWTWQNSLEGGFFTLLLAALLVPGRRWLSPRVRNILWCLAALRLVLPFAPESSLSIFNVFHSSDPAPVAAINIPETSPSEETPLLAETTSSRASLTQSSFDWTSLAISIWLVGTLSVLAFALIQQVRTRCWISQLPEPFDERLHELFLECLASSGLENSHLRLAESPRPGDIAVYGFLRASRLIVPADLLKNYSENEVRGIILHELAHVKRHDLLRSWLVLMVQALHWFNPLAWWVGSRLRAERELICDEMALQNLPGQDRQEYGEALLKTLQRQIRMAPSPALMPFIFKNTEIKHCLAMITSSPSRTRPFTRAALLSLALLASVATFTSATADEKKDKVPHIKIPLEIYVDERGAFIGGKNQKPEKLAAQVREHGKEGVILTSKKDTPMKKVNEVMEVLRKNGATDIKMKTFVPLTEQEKKRQTVEKIQERLKDHKGPLEVYADHRGVFIKGTKLPAGVLAQFAKIYGKEGVTVTADVNLPYKYLLNVVHEIEEAGVKKVRFGFSNKEKGRVPPKTGN